MLAMLYVVQCMDKEGRLASRQALALQLFAMLGILEYTCTAATNQTVSIANSVERCYLLQCEPICPCRHLRLCQ